jgi:hypothetical protein
MASLNGMADTDVFCAQVAAPHEQQQQQPADGRPVSPADKTNQPIMGVASSLSAVPKGGEVMRLDSFGA